MIGLLNQNYFKNCLTRSESISREHRTITLQAMDEREKR